MFPGPHATVYRNEAGEPIGWSDESYYEPEPYDGYDDNYEIYGEEEEDEEDDYYKTDPLSAPDESSDFPEGIDPT